MKISLQILMGAFLAGAIFLALTHESPALGSGTFTEVRLDDGTRCVQYVSSRGRGFSCDWQGAKQ